MPRPIPMVAYTTEWPILTSQHINNCAFESWFPTYRTHVPRCRVIELPPSFITYLCEDGIQLPQDSDQEDSTESDDGSPDPTLAFSDLHKCVQSTIKLFGAVAPRLSWSAPKDSTWIMPTNNMKCTNASEVYMLLKSSTYITHDVSEAYNGCQDSNLQVKNLHLVLRKWIDINPACEFRCFVKDRTLIAITQRDDNFYSFLETMKPSLVSLISDFYTQHLMSFADPHFVFDIYIPSGHQRVWLVDINPFCPKTDSLLVSWADILKIDPFVTSFAPTLHLASKHAATRGFSHTQHSESRVPLDVAQASMTREGMSELVKEWRNIQRSQAETDQDN